MADRAASAAPRRSRTAAPSPRRADHERPPDPAPRRSRTPPHPRAGAITDPSRRPLKYRERGLMCGNPLARARFRKISPLHGLISTDPARRAGFCEISPSLACRAVEHAAERPAKARKARSQRPGKQRPAAQALVHASSLSDRNATAARLLDLRTGGADSADHVLGDRDGGGIELDRIKGAHLLGNLRRGRRHSLLSAKRPRCSSGPRARPTSGHALDVLRGDDRNRTGVDGFAGNDKGVRMALYPVVRVAQFF
jgi:hypothetical protein